MSSAEPHVPCAVCGAVPFPGAALCGTCGTPLDDVATQAGAFHDAPTMQHAPLPPRAPDRTTRPRAVPAGPVRGDGSLPPRPRTAKRRPALILACAALLIGLVGVGAYVVVGGDDDRDDRAGDVPDDAPPAMAATTIDAGASVLSTPDTEWEISIDDVLPGGQFVGIRPTDTPSPWSLAVGDLVISGARDFERGTSVAFAVDGRTGEIAWREDEAYLPLCTPVLESTRLLCQESDVGDLVMVDPSTGTVLATAESDLGAAFAASTRDRVWVANTEAVVGDCISTSAIEAFDAELTPLWQADLDSEGIGEDCHGYYVIDTFEDRVSVSHADRTWHLDGASGDVVQVERSGLAPHGPYYVQDGYESGHTSVYDDELNVLLVEPGTTWQTPEGLDLPNGVLGVGTGLFDLATGEATWSRPDLAGDESYWSWAHDGDYVQVNDGSSTTLLDAATGETLAQWGAENAWPLRTFTDDAAITIDSGGTLNVADFAGETMWTSDLSQISATYEGSLSLDSVGVVVSATSVAVVGSDAVRGFADFGPAPGSEPLGETDTEYATACGSTPEVTPVSSRPESGGIRITFEVVAACPGGHWWSSSAVDLQVADATTTLAQGTLDLSTSPRWVADESDGGSQMSVVFGFRSTFATAEEIDDAVSRGIATAECEERPGSTYGEVPSAPEYADDGSVQAGSAERDDTDEQADALAALERIAADDLAVVESDYVGNWTPQLSSKQPGTSDDGIVYDYTDILAEHLRLRARYADVRLVESTDWGAFRYPDFWVTLAGVTSSEPETALEWCDDQGFASGKCYAKRLSREGPWDESTRHR